MQHPPGVVGRLLRPESRRWEVRSGLFDVDAWLLHNRGQSYEGCRLGA